MYLQEYFFLVFFFPPPCRSQGKKEDAVILLRDSIKYGPEFADAYSSLASLLAEQVRGMALVLCLRVRALLPQPQHLLHLPPVPRSHVVAGVGPRCLHRALRLL